MPTKNKDIKITSVRFHDWCIPYFGNKHIIPYGTLIVTGKVDGVSVKQNCPTRGDKEGDRSPYQYVIFNGARFVVRNIGTMHSPQFKLERWHKKRGVNGRLQYTEDYKKD